jgi:D-alanyl-lipoteichoic acid acyltransferase DltB (MBOAT superfamily)
MGPEIRDKVGTRSAPHRQFRPTSPERHPEGEGWSGLYADEPESCRRRLRPFLLTCAHLGVMMAVFKVYRVEGLAFQRLVAIAMAALPIHYLTPYRWKKPVFFATSVVGLYWVFDLDVTAIVLGLAALLIGVCYLPWRWSTRASIVALIGAGMGFARPESVLTAIPDVVWPVLASMFMFRMIIYLYELKHAKKPEPLVDTLSYFFMLPNSCFMHFPVVDYRTLQRGYFADDVHAIQRRGLEMMTKGTLHLLAYRIIYHKMLIQASEVDGPLTLIGHLVGNYLIYLHVSGQFHIACGMLHLFGFQLPETHHHYLLANSFTDYWRRVNIYWKDFMVRVFFNPVVFRLKKKPQPLALAIATLCVFFMTWFLHAYQLYWLRGTWGFSVPDAMFWGILGLLVLVNVQLDARRTRNRRRNESDGSSPVRIFAVRALKTAGTFTTLALLWSLWYSPSLSAWLDMLRRGSGIGGA